MSVLTSDEFYNRLARAFDVMTDWQARLAFEMPFLQQRLADHSACRVLDTACGTGWHAIALAQRGYTAVGADASPAMIERARANAAQAQANVRFEVATLSKLGDHFAGPFDAILCLGNSLPHLLSQEALLEALRQMQTLLRSGGALILHNLNCDLRLKTKPRFFGVNGNDNTLVWRLADYDYDNESEFITFHTALFERGVVGATHSVAPWSVQVNSTRQRPLRRQALDEALVQARFINIQHYGGLDGSEFDIESSTDLVIVAEV